jgi:hypothetical protein
MGECGVFPPYPNILPIWLEYALCPSNEYRDCKIDKSASFVSALLFKICIHCFLFKLVTIIIYVYSVIDFGQLFYGLAIPGEQDSMGETGVLPYFTNARSVRRKFPPLK